MSLWSLAVVAQNDSTLQQPHELQRVEVVASRYGMETRASVPVQRIDRDRMLRLGIHTMTDALRHIAGITIRDYGGAGGMKTVSVRGIGARHTAVVYDGIALSDCQTGEIDLSRYSLEQLASLRLVIGDDDNIFQPARNHTAAATLYLETNSRPTPQPLPVREGSDYSLQSESPARHSTPIPHRAAGDFGAATDLAVAPQRGANSPFATEGSQGSGSLSFGSFGLVNPSLRFYLPSLLGGDGGRFLFTAFGDFFHADNDYPFSLQNVTLTTREHRTNSRMNAGRGELNLDWQPNDHNTLSAKLYYYNNHRRLPGIVHYYTNENHERLAEQTTFGQLRLRSRLSDQWSLLANAKYNWSHTDYQNRTPGSGLGDANYWQREAYASLSLLYVPLRWIMPLTCSIIHSTAPSPPTPAIRIELRCYKSLLPKPSGSA